MPRLKEELQRMGAYARELAEFQGLEGEAVQLSHQELERVQQEVCPFGNLSCCCMWISNRDLKVERK